MDQCRFLNCSSGTWETSRPGSSLQGGKHDGPGSYVFASTTGRAVSPQSRGHRLFRPLPAQAGHFTRINATPSDLPLISTGRAMYPVPPQRGQLFGSTLPPQLLTSFSPIRIAATTKLILLRNTNRSDMCSLLGYGDLSLIDCRSPEKIRPRSNMSGKQC